MVLHLSRSVQPEAVHRLSLNHLVSKVSGLDAPAARNLVATNLYLFREDVVTDFFARFSNVRSLKLKIGDLLYRTCIQKL